MRVFVTGATGFIGSAVSQELLAHGHQVIGLTRSDEGVRALAAMGVEAHRGDLGSLRAGAAKADGVIHLAFNHDFSRYLENCEDDRKVVEALGAALAGSDRPLIVTSGISTGAAGQLAMEAGVPLSSAVLPRAASEEAANAAAARGANVSIVRLPQVHDTRKQGLVSPLIAIALEKRVSAYVGEGTNRWPAAHMGDVARLYRLALEKSERGAKYHAVAEEGVSAKAIAEALGERLRLPVRSLAPDQTEAHFGWMAFFVGLNMPASSAQTRMRLGWKPAGPGLIADLERLELPAA
ncbi:MAG: SDR family oxidoreductase [Alphaproteobacteria bacterium]|nr:SDR family oxidoreductase [Alphaproteobacteria bacterium]